MIAENGDLPRYINSILIGKNQTIPSSQGRPYQMAVRRSGNTELEVFLTQGESEDPQQCAYLGRYVFTDFPHINDKRAVLDITYTYDKNGTVIISAIERAKTTTTSAAPTAPRSARSIRSTCSTCARAASPPRPPSGCSSRASSATSWTASPSSTRASSSRQSWNPALARYRVASVADLPG